MTDIVGLIPAAGRGVRAYPYTEMMPKSLLEVDGVPLLQRNIELMRDQLGIEQVYIVVGHFGARISERFGDGSALGVKLTYLENTELDRELPYSVYLGAKQISSYCCMILADECYVGSNHRQLLESPFEDALITCGVTMAESPKNVRGNYSVELTDGRITGVIEKPQVVTSLLMGTGTYLLHPEALRRLATAFESDSAPPGDWSTWIDHLARSGEQIRAFEIEGKYVNVNGRVELNLANYMVRARAFEEKKASLVYVADEREESAGETVLRFAERAEIDEVVVATRRVTPSLERANENSKIRLVHVEGADTPVGSLLRRGLDEAQGDVLITAYSDDTFSPRDLPKLLVYLRDADLVVGTRTTRQMIEQGSNMRGSVRLAHVVLAKILELLWWRFDSRFSDICCVYRAVWKTTYGLIKDQLTSTGVEIFPEMVIEVLRARKRVIEIPINYYNNDLESPHVRGKYQNATTFLRIFALMVRKRVGEALALGRAAREGPR